MARPSIAGASITPEIPDNTDNAVPIAPTLSIAVITVSSFPTSNLDVILPILTIKSAIRVKTKPMAKIPAIIATAPRPPPARAIRPATALKAIKANPTAPSKPNTRDSLAIRP